MRAGYEKKCGHCDALFVCAAYSGTLCWCEELPRRPPLGQSDCFCERCLREARTTQMEPDSPHQLVEGEDYYTEGPAIVFTATYHLRRGYCCESGCRHCPYRGTELRLDAGG